MREVRDRFQIELGAWFVVRLRICDFFRVVSLGYSFNSLCVTSQFGKLIRAAI